MAELIGIGPTLYTFSQLADALLNMAFTLKASVDRINQNKDTHQKLTDNIIRHLKQLRSETRRLEGARSGKEDQARALYHLNRDLTSALKQCKRLDPGRSCRFIGWMQGINIQQTLVAVDNQVRRCLELFHTGAVLRVEASLDAIGQAVSDGTLDMKAQLIGLHQDLGHVRGAVNKLLRHSSRLDDSDTESLLSSQADKMSFKSARSRNKRTLQSLSLSLTKPDEQRSNSFNILPPTSASDPENIDTLRAVNSKTAILEIIDCLRTLQKSPDRAPSAVQLDQLAVALFTIGQFDQARDMSRQAVAHCRMRENLETRGRIHLNLASHLRASFGSGSSKGMDELDEALEAVQTAIALFRQSGSRVGLATALDVRAAIILTKKPSSLEGLNASAESVTIRREISDRFDTSDASADYALALYHHASRLYHHSDSHPHGFSAEAYRISAEAIATYQELRKFAQGNLELEYALCLGVHSLCLKDRKRVSAAIEAAWESVEILNLSIENQTFSHLHVVKALITFVSLVSSLKDNKWVSERVDDARQVFDELKGAPFLPYAESLSLAEAAQQSAENVYDNNCYIGAKSLYDFAQRVYEVICYVWRDNAEKTAPVQMGTANVSHGIGQCYLQMVSETTGSALQHAQRAVDILWTLKQTPSRDDSLATALLTLAKCHRLLKDDAACISASETALAFLKTLDNVSKVTNISNIASTHHNLSILYGRDKMRALHHSEEAYNLYQQISKADLMHLSSFVSVGRIYSFLLGESGRHEDALAVAREVDSVAKKLNTGVGTKLRRRATQRLRAAKEQSRLSYRFSYTFA